MSLANLNDGMELWSSGTSVGHLGAATTVQAWQVGGVPCLRGSRRHWLARSTGAVSDGQFDLVVEPTLAVGGVLAGAGIHVMRLVADAVRSWLDVRARRVVPVHAAAATCMARFAARLGRS
ncbi:MAG TPA: hypothetical protein VFB74_07700 [Kribbellaceae bacterium]|nr:hypothetical protein [Kribbellaceae bacterium]